MAESYKIGFDKELEGVGLSGLVESEGSKMEKELRRISHSSLRVDTHISGSFGFRGDFTVNFGVEEVENGAKISGNVDYGDEGQTGRLQTVFRNLGYETAIIPAEEGTYDEGKADALANKPPREESLQYLKGYSTEFSRMHKNPGRRGPL